MLIERIMIWDMVGLMSMVVSERSGAFCSAKGAGIEDEGT